MLFSEMQETKRLDAKFAIHSKSDWLRKIQSKQNFIKLKECLYSLGSGHTPYKHDVSKGDIGFITVECISGLSFNRDKLKKITNYHFENEFLNRRIVKNSVVCTIKRRICQAYPFFHEENLAFNQDIAILIPNSKISIGYLATYLSCKIGQEFANGQQTEQMNPYISLVNLSELPIVVPSMLFQKKIDNLILNIQKITQKYKNLYTEAEDLLLKELDLLDFEPTKENISIKSFVDSFGSSGRLDSEYYLPKYDEVIEKIKKYKGGYIYLIDIAMTKRGSLIPDSYYSTNGQAYIRGADISSNTLTNKKMTYIHSSFQGKSKTIVYENDILFALIGSVGTASLVTKEFENSYLSNNLGLIRLSKQVLKPIVLHLILTSKEIGTLYFEQKEMRTAQPKISDKDIHDFIIPIIDQSIQTQIENKIKESFRLKEESKELLELAKRCVEVAIEEGEEVAMEFIEKGKI